MPPRAAAALAWLVATAVAGPLGAAPLPAGTAATVPAAVSALVADLPACDAARPHCLALHLHVTVGEAGPLVDAAWLTAQLAAANRHFAPLGVAFQVARVDALPASFARVATRRDRDRLAVGRLGVGAIHVFLVGQLDDVDQPGEVIRGVAWHLRGEERKYVLVSNIAPERVLAHEIGHVFGLPHSRYAISIMNKTPRREPPEESRTFADEEIAAMRPRLAELLRAGVIAAVGK